MKSLAMVLTNTRKLEEVILDVAAATPGGGWIKVEATGVCGSDWPWYWEPGILRQPTILGHEIVGRLAEVGDHFDRSDVTVGSRVLIEEAIPCNTCPLCLEGLHRLCRAGTRFGATPISVWPSLWGGYAEYVYAHPRAVLHPLPDDIDPVLATLAIPIANGIDWVSRAGRLRPGENVLIHGPGQHGLACVVAARRLGANKVVVTGTAADQKRLEAATCLGADVTVSIGDSDPTEIIESAFEGSSVDVAIDVTPRATEPIDLSLRLLAPAGRLVLAGAKRGARADIDSDLIFHKEISVVGVCARSSRSVRTAIEWLSADPQAFNAFAGPTLPLSALDEALMCIGGGSSRPVHAVVVP
jgi:alcohol dehydrogenase